MAQLSLRPAYIFQQCGLHQLVRLSHRTATMETVSETELKTGWSRFEMTIQLFCSGATRVYNIIA